MADALTNICPGLFWEDGTPRSQNNCFNWRSFSGNVDMSEESAAMRAGANAAATKRARGQELIPKLHLKGSKHRRRREREEDLEEIA